MGIPAALIYFTRKRPDVPFRSILKLFSCFIIACGLTHFMGFYVFYHPVMRLDALMKFGTALISWYTLAVLWPVIPVALSMRYPEELEKEIEERRLAQEIVQEQSKKLAAANLRLAEANKDLQAFSYSVAHDLRAPLRHIDGFASLLAKKIDDVADEKARHYLSTIGSSARSLGVMIDNLLAFSQLGNNIGKPELVHLMKLVNEVKTEVDEPWREIEWKIGTLPSIEADQPTIRAVFFNLLSNAVKYTRNTPQATISVNCCQTNEGFEFSVTDNGAGFEMQYADKLFGVFQRLHSESEFEGSGIGLASVRRIISKHGGRTWAEGEVDKGATFFFTIPLQKQE